MTRAVITCRFFNDPASATKRAGESRIRRRAMSKRTDCRSPLRLDKLRDRARVAVYDLGWARRSFILELDHGFSVLATNGNTSLGAIYRRALGAACDADPGWEKRTGDRGQDRL